MKSGICPKCGSAEIYDNSEQRIGEGNTLSVKHSWYFTASVDLDRLVCTDCGYVETYVVDKEKLEEIRQFWKPVNKEKRKNE